MTNIKQVEIELAYLRSELTDHRLNNAIAELSDVKIFMENHVFAVWDYMSLLKSLQCQLTCTKLPWKPIKYPKSARYINKMVLDTESDVNEFNLPISRFQMYTDAMQEVGAETASIFELVESTNELGSIESVIDQSTLNTTIKNFLIHTFDIIKSGEPHKIAASFVFGREDILSEMFIEIGSKFNKEEHVILPKLYHCLNFYNRIDNGIHQPKSYEMINELCGDSNQKWDDVLHVAKESLVQRLLLWDSIADQIKIGRKAHAQLPTLNL